MFRITPAIQPYGWGSSTALQALLGVREQGIVAEAWFGTHPFAPSKVLGAVSASLGDVVAHAPGEILGDDVVARFGSRLPYLLKVIAAEHPLSLQVHPNADRAREGFEQENTAGIPLDSPQRNYKDGNHKPELIFALTQFDAMCGFRSPGQVVELFAGLDAPLARDLHAVLAALPTSEGIRAVFTYLLAPDTRPGSDEIGELAEASAARLAVGSPSPSADRTVVLLQEEYPGDPGVATSLLLNLVTLQPGEAMFVPAGCVHAYLRGVGVEIMAASDNVLRAGLTPKHVDVPELLRNVDYMPSPPMLVAPMVSNGATRVFHVPADDFEFSVTDLADDDEDSLPGHGPRILLCLAGGVTAAAPGQSLDLSRGQAAFVPAADGPLTVHGSGRLVQADVP
ncbi:MAG: mannose-6-phosphate isomerase, class I [Micrococcales bacterium]|nr:mannose-6-phosphate isomerase, class I [Micrococcales bacterium]